MLVKCDVENSTNDQTKLNFSPKINATTINGHKIALCEPLWSIETEIISKASTFNINTPENLNSGKEVRSPPPYNRCSLAISSARAF